MSFSPAPELRCNPKAGASFIVKDWSMVDVWFSLHHNATAWIDADAGKQARCDDTDMGILGSITAVGHEAWADLCRIAGWTVYGAVALSWCEGAALDQVWAGWLASGFPLKPLPEFERPARFLNPALLPQTASLAGIVTWANEQGYPDAKTYDLAVSAVIAGLKEPLQFDMEPTLMRNARPQIAAFLRSRMLRKPDRSPAEDDLIATCSECIKSTEFDIQEVA